MTKIKKKNFSTALFLPVLTSTGTPYAGYETQNEASDELLVQLSDGKVACLKCGKHLSSIHSAKRHFISVHQQNEQAQCRVCQKTFKNIQTRDSHSRQAHGVTNSMLKNAIRMPSQQPPY